MEILKNKILVIQTAFLGDAVLVLPMLQFLKEKYPLHKIHVLCIPATKELFSKSPVVDKTISFDKKGSEKSILSFIKLLIKLKKENYDLVFSPHRSGRSTLISFFSKASNTFGFDISDLSFLYKTRIKYEKSSHEVKRNLDLAGFDSNENDWKIKPKLDLEENSAIFNDLNSLANGKKIIAIAPGSVWKTKVYPEEKFIEIIKELTSNDYFIVLIGGKEDYQLCKQIKSKVNESTVNLCSELSITQSISLLKNCNALICNDSAPTHLGMVADIPVLTIYCSTVPEFGFYPYNSKSTFISLDGLSCKPCGIHGHNECPIKTFECGKNLSSKEVILKLREIISV